MAMSEVTNITRRTIRSFVVRNGRITEGQNRALENHWPSYGLEYSANPTDWSEVFGREAPLWIEIGYGNGIQTAHLAALYPHINFLGIEIHLPGVGHLLQLADEQKLQNLKLIRHDAVEVLAEAVEENSVDQILLFFPDPWPKKKHHKRRIVQKDFVDLVANKLKPGGRFHLATDWEPYAEWMLETLSACPRLQNLSDTGDFVSAPDYRLLTKFENRGIKKGHKVHDLLFEKHYE